METKKWNLMGEKIIETWKDKRIINIWERKNIDPWKQREIIIKLFKGVGRGWGSRFQPRFGPLPFNAQKEILTRTIGSRTRRHLCSPRSVEHRRTFPNFTDYINSYFSALTADDLVIFSFLLQVYVAYNLSLAILISN